MNIITEVNDANSLLQTYVGATLQVAFYSESLRRIAIRIYQPNVSEVIYIVGVGCKSLNGRFSYLNADISIDVTHDEETEENITTISDAISGFELITSGGFVLAQGYGYEFGTSFDNFILNKE